MFADTALTIHGETFTWGSATEDGTLHNDTYTNGTQSVTVSGKISHTGLATVLGSDSQGTVDGYLYSGTYYDTHDNRDEQGSWTVYGINFTHRELHSTAYVDISASEYYTAGTTDYSGSNGSLHYWWNDSPSDGSSHWTYTSTTLPRSGLTSIQAFGDTYTYSGTTASGDIYWDATVENWTDNYARPNNATLQVRSTLDYGTFYKSVSAWHPLWGAASSNSTTSAITSTLSGLTWSARATPSFAGLILWVDGKLTSWQSGSLTTAGLITDTYSGDGFTLTVSAHAGDYFEDHENAAVTFTSGGTGSGSLTPTGTFSIGGHVIQKATAFNRSAPFFTGDNTAIKVGAASIYNFTGGYEDSAGKRIDTYANATLGTFTMTGNVSNPSYAAVKVTRSLNTYTGTYNNSTFSLTGTTAAIHSAQPNAYGPPALWVRGEFYTRPNTSTLTYQSAASHTITLGGSTAAPTLGGSDALGGFAGAMDREPVGIFILQDAGGAANVPAIPASTNGSMHLGWSGPPTGFPPALLVGGVPWQFLGVAADDTAPGTQAAYYGLTQAADTTTHLLKLRTDGSGTVTCTHYAAATTVAGSYDPASHLFQTSGPASGFPVPTYAVDPLANNALWLAQPPPGLPPSFVVRGQPWWHAGTDENENVVYRGFYDGQALTVNPVSKIVSLVDPIYNAAAADPETEIEGRLNDERRSARLRDGTLVVSGNNVDGSPAPTPYTDSYALHTIAADLDVVGNNLSFGILQGDASLAGALLQFADQGQTTTLHSTLSRPQSEWIWNRAQSLGSNAVLPVMKLESTGGLSLVDPDNLEGLATIRLDPRPGQASKLPKLELTQQTTADTPSSVMTRELSDARYVQPSVFGQSLALTGGINVNMGGVAGTANTVATGGAALGQNLQVATGQVAVGRYNDAPNSSDVFVVGSGSSSATKDALKVSATGDTTVNGGLAVTGNVAVTGTLKVQGRDVLIKQADGVLRVPEQGDLSMGEFDEGPLPEE